MTKRVTIVIDEAVDRKVRRYQIAEMQRTGKHYSFSKAVDYLLRKALK